MTLKEALNIIDRRTVTSQKGIELHYLLRQVILKQIPKNPDRIGALLVCPCCGKILDRSGAYRVNEVYCVRCGQRLQEYDEE